MQQKVNSTVYIKINECTLTDNKKVMLKDVASVYCSDSKTEEDMASLNIFSVPDNKKKKYVFSSLKVIEIMTKDRPQLNVVNLGNNDFIIEYTPSKKSNSVFEWTKAVLVALAVFFGSGFTIMTFNEDVSVGKVFAMYKEAVYEADGAENIQDNKTMEIAYCIGLPLGIMVFFNHFSKKRFSADPTPLQVQLRTYEKSTNSAIIDNATREGNEIDAG